MDLIFSDIHADISGLENILGVVDSKDFKKNYGEISRIINLGDLLERGTHPKEVLNKLDSLLKNYKLESVMGNHDEAFLYGRTISGNPPESIGAHETLTDEDLSFFKKNKDETYSRQEFIDKKNKIMCIHGGPLNPESITPKDEKENWLYQKTWQRISEEKSAYSSYYGYHYMPKSAFDQVKTQLDNFVIFCGHQHEEAAMSQDDSGIKNILDDTKPKKEKLANYSLEKKEIQIDDSKNYLIRLGLGGPEGYYGTGKAKSHFGIIQDNPRKVILYTIDDIL